MIQLQCCFVILLITQTIFAAETIKKTELIQSPFEACKNTPIVTAPKIMRQSESQVAPYCDFKKGQFIAPEITALAGNLMGTTYEKSAKDFLIKVAKKVNENISSRVADYENLKSCFDNEKKSGCKEKISEFKLKLDRLNDERKEARLIQSALSGMGSTTSKEYLTPKVIRKPTWEDKDIPKSGIDGMNAKIQFVVDDAKGGCRSQKLNTQSCNEFIDKALREWSGQLQIRQAEINYSEMPIFTEMDKPSIVGAKNLHSNKDLSAALVPLIKAGKNQIQVTNKSLANGDLEFTTFGKDRDLVDYMAFRPVVDEILNNSPAYCGIATALDKRFQTRKATTQTIAGVGTLVLFLGGGVGVGALGGASLAAADALNLSVLAMGWGRVANSYADKKNIEEQVKMGVQNYEVLSEKEKDFYTDVILHPLDYAGVASGGRYLGAKISKTFVAATNKVGGETQAANGLKAMAKDFYETVESERGAKQLADELVKSNKAYKKQLVVSGQKQGMSKKESKAAADCIADGNQSACKKVGDFFKNTKRHNKTDPFNRLMNSITNEKSASAEIQRVEKLKTFGLDNPQNPNRETFDQLKNQLSAENKAFNNMSQEKKDLVVLKIYETMVEKGIQDPHAKAKSLLSTCSFGGAK